MKCAHCGNELSPTTARYPSIDYMNAVLGHPVTVAEIDQFAGHPDCFVGPSFGREATILYLAIYNREKITTTQRTKPEPVAPTVTLKSLKASAERLRFRYRLNFEDSQVAATRAFDRGTDLADELRHLANGRRLNETMRARREERGRVRPSDIVLQQGNAAVVRVSIEELLNS